MVAYSISGEVLKAEPVFLIQDWFKAILLVLLIVHLLWLRNTEKPFRLAAKKHIYSNFLCITLGGF